jgi:hypothetical protein
MVAGRVAAQLAAHGFACTLGPPVVSRDAPWPVETEPGTDRGQVELVCDGQPLSLAVQCRYADP